MKEITIPTWTTGIVNPPNPIHEFVRTYVAGRKRIAWKAVSLQVPKSAAPSVIDACLAVQKLPRSDLCTLYIYTTQVVYNIVNSFLRSGSLPVKTFSHDPSTEWQYGQDLLLASASASARTDYDAYDAYDAYKEYLKRGCEAALERYLSARDRTQFVTNGSTEAESKRKWAAVARSYRELRPFFTDTFLAACRSKAIEHNGGIAFYDQAKRVFRDVGFPSGVENRIPRSKNHRGSQEPSTSFELFKNAIPYITHAQWLQILQSYIADLDAIFAKMPPTSKGMLVHRGLSPASSAPDKAYMSTTLDKEIALGFADAATKCCVLTIPIHPGSRVVPMMPVTRYAAELEILLPREYRVF